MSGFESIIAQNPDVLVEPLDFSLRGPAASYIVSREECTFFSSQNLVSPKGVKVARFQLGSTGFLNLGNLYFSMLLTNKSENQELQPLACEAHCLFSRLIVKAAGTRFGSSARGPAGGRQWHQCAEQKNTEPALQYATSADGGVARCSDGGERVPDTALMTLVCAFASADCTRFHPFGALFDKYWHMTHHLRQLLHRRLHTARKQATSTLLRPPHLKALCRRVTIIAPVAEAAPKDGARSLLTPLYLPS